MAERRARWTGGRCILLGLAFLVTVNLLGALVSDWTGSGWPRSLAFGLGILVLVPVLRACLPRK